MQYLIHSFFFFCFFCFFLLFFFLFFFFFVLFCWKHVGSFCKCKRYSHFLSKNISVDAIFTCNYQSSNDTFSNDIVSLQQLGPNLLLWGMWNIWYMVLYLWEKEICYFHFRQMFKCIHINNRIVKTKQKHADKHSVAWNSFPNLNKHWFS